MFTELIGNMMITNKQPAETSKSHERRLREGWYDKYVKIPGVDIGCQYDWICDEFDRWDLIFGNGDATYMEGVPDEKYLTVFAGHILEHLDNPVLGLQNWYRILKPGGYLIVVVPSRDLYEKKKELPSRFNGDHKSFWLPETGEPPCTYGLKETISAALPEAEIVSLRVLDEGWVPTPPEVHSCGEYSIEAVIFKPVQETPDKTS